MCSLFGGAGLFRHAFSSIDCTRCVRVPVLFFVVAPVSKDVSNQMCFKYILAEEGVGESHHGIKESCDVLSPLTTISIVAVMSGL